jgi:S-formylglutathione hydrolase
MTFTTESDIAQFGGKLVKLSHQSDSTKTKMDVNVFLPLAALIDSAKVPVLVYLSGLSCTPNNATEKSFFQYFANKHGFAIVFPDTSPRGANIAGENESYDFGTGAGFYVDATETPWSANYNMYSYVHKELPAALGKHFAQLDWANVAITGHSMGGYGALSAFFREPGHYKSVSAFAPIANPLTCGWGDKCFGRYLGLDKAKWHAYDPTHLVAQYPQLAAAPDILIHQGTADSFYTKDHQLQPEKFVAAARDASYKGAVDLRLVKGYDHLYFFISSFVEEHAKHHARYLGL